MSLSYQHGPTELDTPPKRRKLNHTHQLQSLLSLEKIFNDASLREHKTEMFETPFPHGEDVLSMPQVGKDKFTTILQCYHHWFGSHTSKLTRMGYELTSLQPNACSAQELEVLCAELYQTWQRVKKTLIEKQL